VAKMPDDKGVLSWLACCRRTPTDEDFDQEEPVTYAGSGNGAYTRETRYRYVDKGAGEFEMAAPGHSGTKQAMTLCCGMIAGLFTAVVLLLGIWAAGVGDGGPIAEVAAERGFLAAPPGLRHAKRHSNDTSDCQDGIDSWQTDWPKEKVKRCCSRLGRDCPIKTISASRNVSVLHRLPVAANKSSSEASTLAEPSLTGKLPFDCSKGSGKASKGWSANMKDWCCKHSGRGCPGTAEQASPNFVPATS